MELSTRYLLLSESGDGPEPGHWRFVLRTADGSGQLVVDDVEPNTEGERLELLTVVRGLESLEQPSEVTLITRSAYVREGIQYGVAEWRKNDWRWEAFGRMVPIKNVDLWQRIDRAMRFHRVVCRLWRFDPPHSNNPPAAAIDRDQQIRDPLPPAVEWLAGGSSSGMIQAARWMIARAIGCWRQTGLSRIVWLGKVASFTENARASTRERFS